MTEHYIKLNRVLSCSFLIHKPVVREYFKTHGSLRGGGLHLPSGSVSKMKTFMEESWFREICGTVAPHNTGTNCGLTKEE